MRSTNNETPTSSRKNQNTGAVYSTIALKPSRAVAPKQISAIAIMLCSMMALRGLLPSPSQIRSRSSGRSWPSA